MQNSWSILQHLSGSTNVRPASWLHYSIAIISVGLALIITSNSTTLIAYSPYMMFYAAVTVTAWFGGLWPSFIATLMGALLVNYYFISPTASLDFGWNDIIHMGLFFQVSLLCSSLNAVRRRNMALLQAERDHSTAIAEALTLTLSELKRAKLEWESTVDSFPEIVLLVDSERRILRVNQAVERWGLGSVTGVYDQEVHSFLHARCSSPSCYLMMILEDIPSNVFGAINYEVYDKVLDRRLAITATPIEPRQQEEGCHYRQNYVVVLRDITKFYHLQQANKRREQFKALEYLSGRLAHQISNPLAAMKTTAQVWMRNFDRLSREKQAEYLRKIIDRINHIEALVTNITSGQGWRVQTCSLIPTAEIFSCISSIFEDEMREKEIRFTINEPVEAKLIGNAKAIEEVLINILKNALEACQPHDEITVESAANEMSVSIIVRDSGCGINEAHMGNLFRPFYTTKANGSGVGLAHSSYLMDQMGGRIDIASTAGKGTTATLVFRRQELPRPSGKEEWQAEGAHGQEVAAPHTPSFAKAEL